MPLTIPNAIGAKLEKMHSAIQAESHDGKYRLVISDRVTGTRYAQTEAKYESPEQGLEDLMKIAESAGVPLSHAEQSKAFQAQHSHIKDLQSKNSESEARIRELEKQLGMHKTGKAEAEQPLPPAVKFNAPTHARSAAEPASGGDGDPHPHDVAHDKDDEDQDLPAGPAHKHGHATHTPPHKPTQKKH